MVVVLANNSRIVLMICLHIQVPAWRMISLMSMGRSGASWNVMTVVVVLLRTGFKSMPRFARKFLLIKERPSILLSIVKQPMPLEKVLKMIPIQRKCNKGINLRQSPSQPKVKYRSGNCNRCNYVRESGQRIRHLAQGSLRVRPCRLRWRRRQMTVYSANTAVVSLMRMRPHAI